jgi:hypothetical protein
MGRPTARGLGALVTIVAALACAGQASATTTTQTITSAGPLTRIILGDDLDCQARYAGQASGAFYPAASLTVTPATGDCGTFVSAGASVYGPDFSADYASGTGISLTTAPNYVPYTGGDQSAVSGSGTAAAPFAVSATATAGASGITVSETDRYVPGQDGWRTDITLRNTGAATVSGQLYHAFDCYLQGDDNGYGASESDGAIVCASSAGDASGGPAEELDPLTAGSHYVETYYDRLWGEIAAQTDLPDRCDCAVSEDNAEGINWDFALQPGGSATYSLRTNFAATGATRSSGSGGSGSGGGSTGSGSGSGNQRSHRAVRITLRQFARRHRSGRALALPAGFTGERVRATLHGSGVRRARGTIVYGLYRGRRCRTAHRVLRVRRVIRRGRVPSSGPVARALRAGRYSWQAVYSGDRRLQRARSACGAATLRLGR